VPELIIIIIHGKRKQQKKLYKILKNKRYFVLSFLVCAEKSNKLFLLEDFKFMTWHGPQELVWKLKKDREIKGNGNGAFFLYG
jgi:hypothetical protein